MPEIKFPVKVGADWLGPFIADADGRPVKRIDIVAALNEAAALRERVKGLEAQVKRLELEIEIAELNGNLNNSTFSAHENKEMNERLEWLEAKLKGTSHA